VEHHPQPPTIAILGCDTVVGRSLSVLLEGAGYKTTLLDSYPTGVVDELLEGAHLLILTPRVDQGVHEAFVGAMGKSTPQKADIPMIALSTNTEENLPEKEGLQSVPWPCETKVLIERIEAALLDVPAESTTSTTQQVRKECAPGGRHAPVCSAGKAYAVDHRNGIVQGSAPAARLRPGPLRPRRVGLALPRRNDGRPLQRPGRNDGGHRTGGEDALQGAKPDRLS
jgi:hypothetical protein